MSETTDADIQTLLAAVAAATPDAGGQGGAADNTAAGAANNTAAGAAFDITGGAPPAGAFDGGETSAAQGAPTLDSTVAALRAELASRDAAVAQHAQDTAYWRGVAEARATPTLAEPTAPPPPAYDPAADDLTTEERAAFEPVTPIMQKLMRQQLHQFSTTEVAPLRAALAAAEQRAAAAEARNAQTANDAFVAKLHARHGDLDAIVRTKEWQAHLDTPSPLHNNAPLREVLRRAAAAQELGTISAVVEDYRQKTMPKPTTPAPALPAGRAGVTATPTTLAAPSAPGISDSKIEAATRAYQAGKMDTATYDAMLNQVYASVAGGAPVTA